MRSGAVCIAYETVTDARNGLPLLATMSEVAGMSVQVGAHYLQRTQGGVPGVAPGRVIVLGGEISGTTRHKAIGLEADVTVIDRALVRLEQLDARYGGQLRTLAATGQERRPREGSGHAPPPASAR